MFARIFSREMLAGPAYWTSMALISGALGAAGAGCWLRASSGRQRSAPAAKQSERMRRKLMYGLWSVGTPNQAGPAKGGGCKDSPVDRQAGISGGYQKEWGRIAS